MKKGDIVLIPFPFTDFSGLKTRPALVLVADQFDVTVAFITSKVVKQEINDVDVIATSANGLKVDSLIKLSKLATIDKDLALGELGSLSAADLKKVDEKLLAVFAIKV